MAALLLLLSKSTILIWNHDETRARITARTTVGIKLPSPSGLGPALDAADCFLDTILRASYESFINLGNSLERV